MGPATVSKFIKPTQICDSRWAAVAIPGNHEDGVIPGTSRPTQNNPELAAASVAATEILVACASTSKEPHAEIGYHRSTASIRFDQAPSLAPSEDLVDPPMKDLPMPNRDEMLSHNRQEVLYGANSHEQASKLVCHAPPSGSVTTESTHAVYSVKHGYRISVPVNEQSQASTDNTRYMQILAELNKRREDGIHRERDSRHLETAPSPVPESDACASWAHRERLASQCQWVPLHAVLDPIRAEKEPERVVVFEDVLPYLSYHWELRTARGRCFLLHLFFEVLGVTFPRTRNSIGWHADESRWLSDFKSGGWQSVCDGLLNDGITGMKSASDLSWSPSTDSLPAGRYLAWYTILSMNYPVAISHEVWTDSARQDWILRAFETIIGKPGDGAEFFNRKLIESNINASGEQNTRAQARSTHFLLRGLFQAFRTHGHALSGQKSSNRKQTFADARAQAQTNLKQLKAPTGSSYDELSSWNSYILLEDALGARSRAERVAHKVLAAVTSSEGKKGTRLDINSSQELIKLYESTFRLTMALPLGFDAKDIRVGDSFKALSSPGRQQRHSEALHILSCMSANSFIPLVRFSRCSNVVGRSDFASFDAQPMKWSEVLRVRESFRNRIAELTSFASTSIPGIFDDTPPAALMVVAAAWFEYLAHIDCSSSREESGLQQISWLEVAQSALAAAGRIFDLGLKLFSERASDTCKSSESQQHTDGVRSQWDLAADRCCRAWVEIHFYQETVMATPPQWTVGTLERASACRPFELGIRLSSAFLRKTGIGKNFAKAKANQIAKPPETEMVSRALISILREMSSIYQVKDFRNLGLLHDWTTPVLRRPDKAHADHIRRVVEDILEELIPCGQTFPLLWRVYARVEAALGRWGAVRRVLLRGLSACPWAKCLWLDASLFHFTKSAIQNQTCPSDAFEGAAPVPWVCSDEWHGRGLREAFEEDELISLLQGGIGKGIRFHSTPPIMP